MFPLAPHRLWLRRLKASSCTRGPLMLRRLCLVILVLLPVAGLQGCATLPGLANRPATPPPGQGMTFVADGSGDLRQVSDALANVARDAHAPMNVQRVQWSH